MNMSWLEKLINFLSREYFPARPYLVKRRIEHPDLREYLFCRWEHDPFGEPVESFIPRKNAHNCP